MLDIFANRRDAGRTLASALQQYCQQPDVLVLALPRGGVPVAYEVAKALGAELDVLVVRKLGLPFQPEVAMGAIASGGARVLNERLIARAGVSRQDVDSVLQREQMELQRREQVYRSGRPPLVVCGRTVILVDDGLATGATMEAAIKALRALEPARIVVAVPVAAQDTAQRIRSMADELICLLLPERFMAVGQWYRDFGQTSDDEVLALLAETAER
jgi:putative phosphoribosyl transferase